jgi:hypothetical protein
MKTKSSKIPANAPRDRHLILVANCLLALGFASVAQAQVIQIPYWYNIGPKPINEWVIVNQDEFHQSQTLVEEDSGRVAALAVDPSDQTHWLIGSAHGGIWETPNSGVDWNPRSDNQASLAMGAIAFAPNNPSLVYAGTGEQNFRGDAYAGAGLLVSHDGGGHWGMLNTNFAKTSFSHIWVNPANSSHLVVSTVRGGGGIGEESSGFGNVPGAPPRGVFVSTNGGATFDRVLTGEATALEVDGNNFNAQYAALGEIYGDPTNGVYRTGNGWKTSQLIQGPWMVDSNSPMNIGRIAIAESTTLFSTLYVGVSFSRSRYLAPLDGIWMTTNAWNATPDWTQLPNPGVFVDNVGSPKFWYNFDLLVDPVDANVLYLTEFDVWRFRSGGWTALAGWNIGHPPFPLNEHVHPDNHVMAWVNAASISAYQLLVGNDGGVYISDHGVSGGQWTGLNSNLVVTEFYKGAVDVTGSTVLALGGAQDDFTAVYTGSTAWDMISGGDGTDCAISTTNPVSDWATSFQITTDDPFVNTVEITHTLNGGLPWGVFSTVSSDISDALPFSSEFTVHFEKAPYNDDLFIAGTATLWRCDNFFKIIPSWSPNSPTMVDTNGAPVPISAMAFAPSQKDGMVYAFGTEDGQLQITSNGGGNWSDLDPAKVLPARYISGLAFSPTDRNVLYVTLSGFDESTPGHPGHLFNTTNALASPPTWVNISPPVDLPNNCLAIDPNVAANIYVGADIGVWNSTNGGGSWTHYGPDNGMPNVPVYDLRMNSSSKLTAFTHGRGAYYLGHMNKVYYFHPDDRITRNFGCLTCPPDEPWLNPGDLETVEIALQGVLPVDSVDLNATMLASPEVSPISGTQDYGAVTGQGAPVSQVFQFIANAGGASCGGTVQVVLQLKDQGVDVGQVSIPFRLGVPSHPLVQSFAGAAPPGLPADWSSAATGASPPWMITTNQPTNLPDQGEDISAVPPPHSSAMALDLPGSGQTFLISPPFTVVTPQAQLYFLQAFSVPNPSDGAILEIAMGTQAFQDIIRAGGSFVEDGYNTVLSDRNPIGPLPAWSGDSGGWVPVVVNLPPAAAGQPSQLRWRLASSLGATNGAWFVDSVLITEHLCLPPVSNPVIVNPILSGNSFSFAINTVAGRNYVIEYKTNLTDVAWQTLRTLSGNGSQQTINVPIGSGPQAFYRFHLQP